MSQGRLLVLGNLKGTALSALESARQETGYEATIMARADDAIHELDRPQLRALVVDLTTPGAARFCQEARARRALFNVPLIALSPKLTDLAFSNAQRWGADDVVALGAADALKARLEFIPEIAAPLAMATRGEAVIADTDRGRCDVLGRVLANAGFNVKYATDPVATRFYLSKRSVRLFVLNTELGEPAAMINEARAAGNPADWVITTKTLAVEALREELVGLERVIVMPSHGPPENALFAINLLQPSADAQSRTEVRALHAAVVVFRALSWERDEYGFTYSVSAGGLYLRTLVRPPKERVWLELTPPNVPRKVKLLAEVAWSRTFGQPGAETAPPGFGVHIVDGQGDDLALWRQGFESLDVKSPAATGMPELRPSTTSFRIPLPAQAATVRANSLLPGVATSLAPAVASLRPNKSAANLSRAVRSLNPSAPEAGGIGRPSADVVVPSSTWSAPEYTPRPPSVELPRPPSTSSQAAVLAALRTSLLPNAPLPPNVAIANPVIRELDDAEPRNTPQPELPIKLDTSALLDPDAGDTLFDASANRRGPSGGRVVRTVLGVGQVPPAAAFTPAPPPPLTLDQLGAQAAPNTVELALGSAFENATETDDLDPPRSGNLLPTPPITSRGIGPGDSGGEFLAESEITSVHPPASEAFVSSAPLDSMVGAPPEEGGPVLEPHLPLTATLQSVRPQTAGPQGAVPKTEVLGLFDKTEPDQRAFVLAVNESDDASANGTADLGASTRETEAAANAAKLNASGDAQKTGSAVRGTETTLASKAVNPDDLPTRDTGAHDTGAHNAGTRDDSTRAAATQPRESGNPKPPRRSETQSGVGRKTEPPPRRTRPGEQTLPSPWQDETAPATSGSPASQPPKVAARSSKAGWVVAGLALLGVLGVTQIYSRFGIKGADKVASREPTSSPQAGNPPIAPPPAQPSPAQLNPHQLGREPALPAGPTASSSSAGTAVASVQSVAPPQTTQPLASQPETIQTEELAGARTTPPSATDGNSSQGSPLPGGPVLGASPDDTQVTVRAPAPSPPDTASLAEDTAWLFVHSTASARVFVNGVDHGATNEWIRSRCGGRFIRLGTSPGAWLSAGIPTKLRCRQTNEIELNPSAE